MNDSSGTTTPADAPSPQRRGLFDQTWEVELLISGALVFALLGAPARIEGWWDRMSVIAADDLRMTYFFAYYYASLLAYTLIATFVLHIAARAYWVGLAGLHSVYPEGVDWDSIQNRGPIGIALSKRLVPSLGEAVRNADGFCRFIFAFAAILVLNLVLSVFAVIALGVPSYLIATYVIPGANLLVVGGVVFVVTVLIPFAGAGMLDRRLRERIPADSRLGRTIRQLLRVGYYATLGPVLHPLILTIATRTSQRRFSVTVQTIGLAVVLIFLANNGGSLSDSNPFTSFLLGPAEASEAELLPEHYADQRAPGAVYRRAPAIQSEVIDGDYIRLFIPYYPHADNDLLRERCADLTASADGSSTDDAAGARCLGNLYALSIDSAPLAPLHFDFATDPGSGMRGVVTRIPVAELPTGRHSLRLVRVLSAERRAEVETDFNASEGPDRGTLAEAIERESRVHVIPFWR